MAGLVTAGRRVALAVALSLLAGAAVASQRFAAEGEIEVAFAPRDDTEKVVIELIRSARKSLEVQAYAFTSRSIADALVAAQRRGVRVEVLADAQMNRRGKGNAIGRLLAAGVPVAFETRYNAAHNKVIIVDAEGPRCALLTGSYNFTWSANNRNAENLLIVREHCELARAYRANWLRHRKEATRVSTLPWRGD
ncbi:phospholipase D family protein [Thauera sp.]|jgi:phosphatidylserine/phosphatidylglycerophosphate/cardiolipin synthase-like enzyme|uniref:phospholipase D family nuclease n=1 Tax=Thauera sp. TaxID=1905334 RepID=UPI00261A6476|nr:phospholipase D family protein [Thauera sp.]MCK6408332.1 phospholipase D family protein [Thauera sp.]